MDLATQRPRNSLLQNLRVNHRTTIQTTNSTRILIFQNSQKKKRLHLKSKALHLGEEHLYLLEDPLQRMIFSETWSGMNLQKEERQW